MGGLPSSTSVTPKPEGETLVIKTEAIQIAMPSDTGGGEVVGSTSTSSTAVSSPCNVPQTPVKDARSSGEGNSSALHWLADLATQKAKDDTKGKYEITTAESGFLSKCKARPELVIHFLLSPSRVWFTSLHDESRKSTTVRPGLSGCSVETFCFQS